MIIENNVELIINTTRCTEDGVDKCFQYWPSVGEQKFNISQDKDHPEYITVRITFTLQRS